MQATNNNTTFSDTPACVLNDVYDVPMPGDFVEVIDSLDSQAPSGCFGVILGFKNNSKDEYDICFNPTRALGVVSLLMLRLLQLVAQLTLWYRLSCLKLRQR
ncbi:hypothetical protein [Vibrio cholerae]|uniref:hypothetical protein n=1 Tax=Vibrio cholerae TaxID=666 RepID=UPI000CCEA26B|nr:hypothetical protein [Vibrio cholerae]PNV69323.1 hypothetical protein C1Y48_18980 [Vibrio cholerae]